MTKVLLTYTTITGDPVRLEQIASKLQNYKVDVRWEVLRSQGHSACLFGIANSSVEFVESAHWLFVCDRKSLASIARRKEISKSLETFGVRIERREPALSILLDSVPTDWLPLALRGRPYLHVGEHGWSERLRALTRRDRIPSHVDDGMERGAPLVDIHRTETQTVFELRPHSGRWNPCRVAVSLKDREKLLWTRVGPMGHVPVGGSETTVTDRSSVWYIEQPEGAASRHESLYVCLARRPSSLWFRTRDGMHLIPTTLLRNVPE